MAPFTHTSPDRPSRFSAGTFGVLYAASRFEVALLETVYHHGRFMARTDEPAGWTSQFREIVLDVTGDLYDLRADAPRYAAILDPDNYAAAQGFGSQLRKAGAEGIVYPSVRSEDGECVGLFYPDLAANPIQGRHLDYHWNGNRVDLYRDAGSGQVYRIV
jgi:RES domain